VVCRDETDDRGGERTRRFPRRIVDAGRL